MNELTADQRARWIDERAYYLAAARGFSPGGELGDWIAAEHDFEATFSAQA